MSSMNFVDHLDCYLQSFANGSYQVVKGTPQNMLDYMFSNCEDKLIGKGQTYE